MKTLICILCLAISQVVWADADIVDPSKLVEVSIAPDAPVVITADFQMNDSTIISAPWFAMRVVIDNKSKKPVTIIALQYHVTAKRVDGTWVTKDITMNPSTYNFTQACSNGTTQAVNFTDFGEWKAGQKGMLSLTPRDTKTVCGEKWTPLVPLIYVGGLPSPNIDHVVDYNQKVEMSLVGWFGTTTDPDSRLNKTITFYVQ